MLSERVSLDVAKITRFLPSDLRSSMTRPTNFGKTFKNRSVGDLSTMRNSSAPTERMTAANANQILQQRKNLVKQTQGILRDHDLAMKQMKTLRI